MADYYSDQLAARLAALDAERAFALFDRAMRDDRPGQRWNPLTASPQFEFWRSLTRIDRNRALALLLDAARSGNDARWTVQWHLPNFIDLQEDVALLGNYAARGVEEAFTVCHAITGGRPGFWQIAFRLVDLHSTDMRHELELRIEQMGQIIVGPYSGHIQRCLEEVEQARQLPGSSTRVRAWLEDYAARLTTALQEHRRREADERINRG